MFYSMGYSEGRNDQRAEKYTATYAADASKQVERRCTNLAGTALAECTAQTIETNRENQRGESDLAAQWKAANWVFWAAIIAAVQLIVSGFGLLALLETLKQGRKALKRARKANRLTRAANERATQDAAAANVIANRNAKAAEDAVQVSKDALAEGRVMSIHENRAWIIVKHVRVRVVENPSEPFAVELIYENQGQTPAFDVYSQHRVTVLTGDDASLLAVDPPPKQGGGSLGILARGVEENNIALPDGSPQTVEVVRMVATGRWVVFGHGWITYRDVFGEKRRTTYKWFLDKSCVRKNTGMMISGDGNEAT